MEVSLVGWISFKRWFRDSRVGFYYFPTSYPPLYVTSRWRKRRKKIKWETFMDQARSDIIYLTHLLVRTKSCDPILTSRDAGKCSVAVFPEREMGFGGLPVAPAKPTFYVPSWLK